jgi:prepilin-type N-terminal cleavage/methylation domain-containing protein
MRLSSRSSHRPQPGRRGFTIVEMIVAIIILGIGIMGLAGTASYVAIQMGGAAKQTIAAGMAQTNTDSLSARRCAAVVNGTDSSQGVRVTWTVADSGKTKWVSQAVRFRTKTGVKTVNSVAVVPCVD